MKNSFFITLISIIILASANVSASYNSLSISEIKTLIIEQANQQQVSPALALAIAKVESDFNPLATSSAGARGVMQIMPKTSERVFGVSRDRLYDAQTNIELGIQFIKQLLGRYDQRLDIALSHYNGGSAVKGENGHLHVIPHTQAYVNKVLGYYRQFDITPYYSPFHTNQTVKRSGQFNYKVGEVHNLIHDEKTNHSVSDDTNLLVKTDNITLHNTTSKKVNKGVMIKGPRIKKVPERQRLDTTAQVNTYPYQLEHNGQHRKQYQDLNQVHYNQGPNTLARRLNTVSSWQDFEQVKPVAHIKKRKAVKKPTINNDFVDDTIVAQYLHNKTNTDKESQVRQWESIFK